MTKALFGVHIIESEIGWGQKIDETRYFFTKESAEDFVREFNCKNTSKTVPDWYRFASEPFLTEEPNGR